MYWSNGFYFNFSFNTMSEKSKHLVESFLWRFYNTFKVVIFPAMAFVLLDELKRVGDLSCLSDPATWGKVGFAVIVALLSAGLAGIDKVSRENIRLEE